MKKKEMFFKLLIFFFGNQQSFKTNRNNIRWLFLYYLLFE